MERKRNGDRNGSSPVRKRHLKSSEMLEKDSLNSMKETSYIDNSMEIDNMTYGETDESNSFEAGIILKVDMEDFMIHRKFTVKFGRQVNFLTGLNGSGKSACVAAIQLCLGATARRSGRASTVSGMIRQGSSGPAIVRVTLLNECDDAYKPESYGNRIIIERKIFMSGVTKYSLRSADGVEISDKRPELENILRCFNIFVDNPCCLLTQEESKKFITGHESDKYQFFLKATGLERIHEEISTVSELIESSASELEGTKAKIIKKEEIVEALKKDVIELDALEKYECEVRLCMAKKFWIDVQENSETIKELHNKHENQLQECEKLKGVLHELTQRSQDGGNMEDLMRQQEEIEEEKNKIVKEVECIQIKIAEKMKACHSIDNNKNLLQKQLTSNCDRIKSIKKEIRDLQHAALEAAEENERAIIVAIQERTSEITTLEEKKTQTRNALDEVLQIRHQNNEMRNRYRSRVETFRNEISRIERELSDITNSGGNGRLMMFGDKLGNVMQKISRTKFVSEVHGPVGMCIKVIPGASAEANALEKLLWGNLRNFVVDNYEDRNTLFRILSSEGAQNWHYIIVQNKRSRYIIDTNPNLCVAIDLISVDSDVVYNAIVDQSGIDKVAIVQGEEDCMRNYVEADPSSNRDRLKFGLKKVITRDGTTIKFAYGNKSSEMNSYPSKKLLAADTTEIINSLKANLLEEREKLSRLSGDEENHRRQDNECNQRLNALENELKQLNGFINSNRKKLQELQEKLSEMHAVGKVDFSYLEKECEELEVNNSEITRRLDLEKGNHVVALDELKIIQNEKNQSDVRKRKLVSALGHLETKMEEIVNGMEHKKKEIAKKTNDLYTLERIAENTSKLINGETAKSIQLLEVAKNNTKNLVMDWNGEPLELSRRDTKQALDHTMLRVKALIEERRKKDNLRNISRAELHDRLTKAVNDHNEHHESYIQLKQKVKRLKKDNAERQGKWAMQITHYGKMVGELFNVYMNKRGFCGTVTFDHENKKLLIKSQTDNADVNSRCDDVRQLSGGERSYTTLCLLMALGHVIECPFRIMDEYDVFLDQVVRKITLVQLMNYALTPEQRHRQFIIITPQDLSDIQVTNEVRIIRCPDPVRNTAHGAQQQTLGF